MGGQHTGGGGQIMAVMCSGDISTMTISPLPGEMKEESDTEKLLMWSTCVNIKCDLILHGSYEGNVGKGLEMTDHDWI